MKRNRKCLTAFLLALVLSVHTVAVSGAVAESGEADRVSGVNQESPVFADSIEYGGTDSEGGPLAAETAGEPGAELTGEQDASDLESPDSADGEALDPVNGKASDSVDEEASDLAGDEIIVDGSEDDMPQPPEDVLPASECADEAAAISADSSDLIEAIEVVDEAPSLISDEETVETVEMEIGKKLSLYFTENSRKVLTFSPEQTGIYILKRTEVQDIPENYKIEACLYENDDEDYFERLFSASDSWALKLEAGVQYCFELVPFGMDVEPFDAEFTLIEAPEIASLEWGRIPAASDTWGKGVLDVTTLLEYGRQISLNVTYTDDAMEPQELWNWDVDEETGNYVKTTSSGTQLCLRLFRKSDETTVAVDSLLDAGEYQFRVYQIDSESGKENEWTELRKDIMVKSGATPGVTTLETGKGFDINCGEGEYYSVFSFTPKVSGEYQLRTEGKKDDLIAYLYGSDKRFLEKDETDGMISLSYDLRKGVTYYYLVRNCFLSDQVTGVTVYLDGTDVIDITEATVSPLTDSPWNVANVADMMRQIKLSVSYDGTYKGSESITEWQPDAEKGISYYSARLSCGATIRMELYREEEQVSVDQIVMDEGSYQIRFYSEVYVDHDYEKTELENLRQNITVSGSSTEKEFDRSGVESLSLGAGEAMIYSYTPDTGGWYLLYPEGDAVITVSLYDENNRMLDSSDYVDNSNSFAYNLKENTIYRYKISGCSGNAVSAVKLYLIPAVTVASVELVAPPSCTTFVKGTDKTVSAAGAQLKLTYTDGIDPEVLEFGSSNTMKDSHGNTVDFNVHINVDGEPGSPDTPNVDDLGVGDYFLGVEVTQCTGAILGASRLKIYVPIKVTETETEKTPEKETEKAPEKETEKIPEKEPEKATGQAPEPASHSHSWGEWTVTKPATALETGIQSRKCTAGDGATDEQTIPKLTPVLELAANNIVLKKGQSTTKLKVTEMAAGDFLVSAVSSDPKLLKVSDIKASGTFKLKALKTSKKAVQLTITLKSGESKTVKVKLQPNVVVTKAIKGVKKTLTLKVKERVALEPVITPITTQDKLKYTSSDKKVATVSKKGVITAKKAGKAKITVQSGKKKVTCTVTVKK